MKMCKRGLTVLVLCMCLLTALAAGASAMAPVASAANSATHLRTSYNDSNYLDLSISGSTLTVSGRLLVDGLQQIQVQVGSVSRTVNAADGQLFSTQLTMAHSGSAAVRVYTKTTGTSFTSLTWRSIYIQKGSGGYAFLESRVLKGNLAFTASYLDPQDAFRIQVPDSVAAKSQEIVGDETDDYTKVFLLNQWVAENIYYDYDALNGLSERITDSAGVLEYRRSVCEGYAKLLRDLILAQGIPAIYSLNDAVNSSSYALTTSGGESHAHTEAYVDGRWIVMDATWDSNNKYQNGVYSSQAPNGFFYFDITPEVFALDHKITARDTKDYVATTEGFGYSPDGLSIVAYDGPGGAVVIPDGVTAIADYAFLGNGDITSLTVPESVRSIGRSAFEGCYSLLSVTLPDSLTSIGKSAFSRCRNLSNLRLPGGNVTIGDAAFFGSAITELTITSGMKLGESVFCDCEELLRVVLEPGVTTIPYDTFNNCWSITSLEIPATVTTIATRAFVTCNGLEDVYFGGTQSQWESIAIGERNDVLSKATIHFNSAMPEEVPEVEPEEEPEDTGPVMSKWAQASVERAVASGFVPDGIFGNDYTESITRAQFAALAVKTYETLHRGAVPYKMVDFADCSGNVAVVKAYNLGLLQGYNTAPTYGEIYIGPDDPITREQAATMVVRLIEYLGPAMPTADELPFTDSFASWAEESVFKVYKAGIMTGTSATVFSAKSDYTIEQSIVTMIRVADYLD